MFRQEIVAFFKKTNAALKQHQKKLQLQATKINSKCMLTMNAGRSLVAEVALVPLIVV